MNNVSLDRRMDTAQHTPAEQIITEAMMAVEALPASKHLTDAVILLSSARSKVADFVDNVPEADEKPTPCLQEEPIMQFFSYEHLPGHLQAISKPFCNLAEFIMTSLPRNAERSTALRRVLEAKDCAVRAFIAK